jgi:hypothetical protein
MAAFGRNGLHDCKTLPRQAGVQLESGTTQSGSPTAAWHVAPLPNAGLSQCDAVGGDLAHAIAAPPSAQWAWFPASTHRASFVASTSTARHASAAAQSGAFATHASASASSSMHAAAGG